MLVVFKLGGDGTRRCEACANGSSRGCQLFGQAKPDRVEEFHQGWPAHLTFPNAFLQRLVVVREGRHVRLHV